MSSRKRIALVVGGVATAGAAAVLSLGATSALYSSGAVDQTNTIDSGVVELTKDAAQSIEFHVDGFVPGDSVGPSKYYLNYHGEDAFVGLDLNITSTAQNACSAFAGAVANIAPASVLTNCTATGTVPMFDGQPGAGSLDLSVLPENGNTAHQLFNLDSSSVGPYLSTGTTCSSDVAGVVTCTVEKQNVILPPGSGTELKWADGHADWVTVKATLPLDASNIFQGSTVAINLVAHAVQYDNNNSTLGTAGGCDATTIFPSGISAGATTCPVSWL